MTFREKNLSALRVLQFASRPSGRSCDEDRTKKGRERKKKKEKKKRIPRALTTVAPAYVDQNAVIPIFSGASNWLRDNNSASCNELYRSREETGTLLAACRSWCNAPCISRTHDSPRPW